jgi:hypothetical protein
VTVVQRDLVVVGLIILAVSVLCLRPSIRGIDGAGNYVWLRSALIAGDVDFRDDYAAIDRMNSALGEHRFQVSNEPVAAATGMPANRYGIGSALFWAPFVVPTHIGLKAAAPELADGVSRPYVWAVGVGSAFWAGFALWLIYRRLRRSFSRIACALSVAGLPFATGLGFYAWAHGSHSHAVSFFAATCALLALERYWTAPRALNAALVGLWCGVMILIRTQDASWAIVIVAAMACIDGNRLRRAHMRPLTAVGAMIVCLAVLALALLPQVYVWKTLYGSWVSGPQPYMGGHGGSFSLLPRHFFDAWFSGRHGALSWHPLLAIGLAGLIAMWYAPARGPNERKIAVIGLAGFLVQSWLIGSWSYWWAGASFGNRFFISSYPWLAFGLAATLESWERRGQVFTPALAIVILVLWNAGLLVQYGAEIVSREDEITLGTIVFNQFTAVPEWSYLKIRDLIGF